MKNVNFVPKDFQRVLSSHRISEKCIEQEVRGSIKKLPLKISQYSQENACVGVSFFIKIQIFFMKRDSSTGVFQ